jgi:hypothetical protein
MNKKWNEISMEETFQKGIKDGKSGLYHNPYYYREAYNFGFQISDYNERVIEAIENKIEKIKEILDYMSKGNSIMLYNPVNLILKNELLALEKYKEKGE